MGMSLRVKPEPSLRKAEEMEQALKAAALKSLRDFRKQRVAKRQLPCQPKLG